MVKKPTKYQKQTKRVSVKRRKKPAKKTTTCTIVHVKGHTRKCPKRRR